MTTLAGKFFVAGAASGPALVLPSPLSFWGGVDPQTGAIIDRTQATCGATLAGKVLVMPSGRGSSSSSSVVAEVIRNGLGPVAFVMQQPDPIITAGAIVARSLYGIVCPVVTTDIGGISADVTVSISITPDSSAAIYFASDGISRQT
jgi:predicted aconitase with swiveling domain